MLSRHNDYIEWLHLSDLHINYNNIDQILQETDYKKIRSKCDPDFIVVTGDFRNINSDKDFENAKLFLNKICSIFSLKKENVFLVPGNHDVTDSIERKEYINNIKENLDKVDVKIDVNKDFGDYIQFVKSFYGNDITDDRTENPAGVISVMWNNAINIIMLNSALISDGDRTHKEVIDIDALAKIRYDKNKPIFILAHHAINNIHPTYRQRIEHLVSNGFRIAAWLCGDCHKPDLDRNNFFAGDDNKSLFPCITCGKSVADAKDTYSRFSMMQYTFDKTAHCCIKQYDWSSECGFNERGQFLDINVQTEIQSVFPKVKIYQHILDAHSDIVQDMRDGKCVDFYGLRGATFSGDDETNAITSVLKTDNTIKLRLLISNPFSEKIRYRLAGFNENNAAKYEVQWADIYENAKKFLNASPKNYNVRYHDNTLLYRFIITKRHLYMGYYEPNKKSSDSQIYRMDSNTTTYKCFQAYFEFEWGNASKKLPNEIPLQYSFFMRTFPITPSLVINITSNCEMGCVYCPEGGENLQTVSSEISKEKIVSLVNAFREYLDDNKKNAILRITGGEPLYDKNSQEKVTAVLEAARNYKKIVLCTNGLLLQNVYERNKEIWNQVKSKLLLKVSLDTVDPEVFIKITGTGKKGGAYLKTITENIRFMRNAGFSIELNVVLDQLNIESEDGIFDVFNFAKDNKLIGIKVLTINDFGGVVKRGQDPKYIESVEKILKELMTKLKNQGYIEKNVYLNGNTGIQMKRFVPSFEEGGSGTTFTIVDHTHSESSITPTRTFSTTYCKDCCYYKELQDSKENKISHCSTGMMSLILRADGQLSPCRAYVNDTRININDINGKEEMKTVIENFIQNYYGSCIHA